MKRIPAILLILLLSISSCFSIEVFDKVLSVGVYTGFAQGLFPTSIDVEFEMPGLHVFDDRGTRLAFSISAGYAPRELLQDPKTGDYLKWEHGKTKLSDGTEFDSDQKYYSTIFSTWNLAFSQGFGRSPINNGDLATLSISYAGRWEQATERLESFRHDSWASDNKLTFVGPLQNGTIATRPIFDGPLVGAPDLQGNRYLLSTSINLGLVVNMYTGTETTGDGFKWAVGATWAPWWLANDLDMFGGRSDYWKISTSLSAEYTLYQLQQSNGWNWLSFTLYDLFSYRYLDGTSVPRYAETGGIWKVSAQNLQHSLTNSLRLYAYGPQFLTNDCYPYLYTFLDLGYSGGHLNNTDHTMTYHNFMGSTGVHLHLRMFGIFHMYYEVGYVFGPEKNKVAETIWPGEFGFYINLY